MSLDEARKRIAIARRLLEKVQAAESDTDSEGAVMWAFYAYENCVSALAARYGRKLTRNHREKAQIARRLYADGLISRDVGDELEELNRLRKDVAYDEPGPELQEKDLYSITDRPVEMIEMNETVKTGANSVLDALTRMGLTDTVTMVLIGSGARDTMNDRSDVDILILHDDDRRIRLERPGDIHLQQYSRSRFLSRLEDGDDYPSWALRFGIPMHDPGGWWAKHVAAELDNPHWPDWHAKLDYAWKRMSIASALFDLGDLDAASEEMMFAASHVARAVLLKHGVFPLSRPELPAQLESIEPNLGCILDRLISGDVGAAGLKSGKSLLKCQIEQLGYVHTATAALTATAAHS